MKQLIAIFATLFVLSGCADEEIWNDPHLTSEQRALIGTAVNFDVSMAEEFVTRTSYNHDGPFNDGDLMVIYRQYWDDQASPNDWHQMAYRSYTYDLKYASGTTVILGRNWKVSDKYYGANWDDVNNKLDTPFKQTPADSLTWENGKTVRFRAWSRSNLAGCNNGEAGRYYPDFCIANWATVSGPTMGIPLTLRHLGCRIGFVAKGGNQFAKGEICTDEASYRWEDNADTQEHDTQDKEIKDKDGTTVSAVQAATNVANVYNKMCMPSGVNMENGTLNAMTTGLFTNLKSNNGFNHIEQKTTTDGIIEFGTKTSDDISTEVQRPLFNNVDGRLYMITIPYDMSSEAIQGEELVLPPYTRFKIYLRDVNNGDQNESTSGYEFKEHIFSLSDIKGSDRQPKYPDGLRLESGRSYTFSVGYQYDQLQIEILQDGMAWSEETISTPQESENQDIPVDDTRMPYQWFTDAINTAIGESKVAGQDYNPIFRLSTREDMVEFVNLVNGTIKTSGIKRVFRDNQKNPEYDKAKDPEYKAENDPEIHPDLPLAQRKLYGGYYWWYDEAHTTSTDTTWIGKKEAASAGYVIYNRYIPQISTQVAHSEEVLLTAAYSFYDEQLPLHFVVQLQNDLDMADWKLPSIGATVGTQFKGYFDGGMHTLSNVYMQYEFLFGYMTDGEIRDLKIESTHPTALLKKGTATETENFRIAGISLKANTTKNPIAEELYLTPQTNGSVVARAYVVGCIQYGNAGGALVGKSNNLYMLGCMRTADNQPGGALLGQYGSSNTFFSAIAKENLNWNNTRFACNYFVKTPDLNTRAIGFEKDGTTPVTTAFTQLQYIRGAHDYVLKAKLDNLLGSDGAFNSLTSDLMREEFYGLAPWKAMNYAIKQYNTWSVATNHMYKMHNQTHKCQAHYTLEDDGFANRYPQLVGGEPTETQNPYKQNN